MSAATRTLDPVVTGSAWQQASVGVLGIVLGIVLIIGQISLATTRGMEQNLADVIINMDHGNETTAKIIETSQASADLVPILKEQDALLGSTADTMVLLNEELDTVSSTTAELSTTVQGMKEGGDSLLASVQSMARDAATMAELLQALPASAKRTQADLQQATTDSTAIRKELDVVGNKMEGYGLAQARGVGR